MWFSKYVTSALWNTEKLNLLPIYLQQLIINFMGQSDYINPTRRGAFFINKICYRETIIRGHLNVKTYCKDYRKIWKFIVRKAGLNIILGFSDGTNFLADRQFERNVKVRIEYFKGEVLFKWIHQRTNTQRIKTTIIDENKHDVITIAIASVSMLSEKAEFRLERFYLKKCDKNPITQ